MKKIIIALFSCLLIFPMYSNVNAFECNENLNTLWENRQNFKLAYSDISKTVSFFTTNGVRYELDEVIAYSGKCVKSKYYRLDNGKTFLGEQSTIFNENNEGIEATMIEKNKVIYKSIIRSPDNMLRNNNTNNCNSQIVPYSAKVSSRWFSQGVYKGSNNIARYTVSALIALIGYISGTATGVVISALAEKAVSEHWPAVYYSKETFVYMKRCPSWPSYPDWVVAGKYKYITKFYANSSRKQCKGTVTHIDG